MEILRIKGTEIIANDYRSEVLRSMLIYLKKLDGPCKFESVMITDNKGILECTWYDKKPHFMERQAIEDAWRFLGETIVIHIIDGKREMVHLNA